MAVSGRKPTPEVIWTRPERAGRGPRAAHSRAEIAEAAMRIADADGLDAVSMRRVAAEIGCGTMSLYNYVPRKEDLYELMVDAASADYDLSTAPSGGWRADILRLAGQSRALMHQHPWLPRLTAITAYGFTPRALAYMEYFLAALDPLDVPADTKVELLAMVSGTVTTYVNGELGLAEHSRSLPWSPEEEQAVRGAYLGKALESGEYPRLAVALAASFAEPVDYDAYFLRTLNRVLDAFESGSD